MSYHKVNMEIESDIEAVHLVKVVWWLEELKFKAKLWDRIMWKTANHTASLKPMVHQDLAKRKICKLLGLGSA